MASGYSRPACGQETTRCEGAPVGWMMSSGARSPALRAEVSTIVAGRVVVFAWRVGWRFACGFAWRLAFRGCEAPVAGGGDSVFAWRFTCRGCESPVAGGGDFGVAGFRARPGAARLDAVRSGVALLGAVRLFVCWLCVRCIARSAYHASGFLSCGSLVSWRGRCAGHKGLADLGGMVHHYPPWHGLRSTLMLPMPSRQPAAAPRGDLPAPGTCHAAPRRQRGTG